MKKETNPKALSISEPRDEQGGSDETEQRLQKILQGAFAGSPTPLKDIPTATGEKRAERKDQPPRKRRQRKNRAA